MPVVARALTIDLRRTPEPKAPDQERGLRKILEASSLLQGYVLDVAMTGNVGTNRDPILDAALSLAIGLALLGQDLETAIELALTRAEFMHTVPAPSSPLTTSP
jgi:hypothetical protein